MANDQQQRGSRRQNNNNRQSDSTAVAVVQPVRMAPPAGVLEQYNLTPDAWRATVDAVFPLAKTVGAVVMALAYCERHKLDVFQRVVHIVPMRVGRQNVETVWPGIALYRIRAQRQPDFDGWDDCEFGEDVTTTFRGKQQQWDNNGNKAGVKDVEVELTHPEWAQFIVYKWLHGRRVKLPGGKIWFNETFSEIANGVPVPNARWQRAPRQMLEKCAEAAALRRAWPDVFGGELTAEEAEGKELSKAHIENAEYVEVDNGEVAETKTDTGMPTRADFRGQQDESREQGDQGGAEGDGQSEADRGPGDAGAPQTQTDRSAGAGEQGSGQQSSSDADGAKAPVKNDGPPDHGDGEWWGNWLAGMRTRIKTRDSDQKLTELEKAQQVNYDAAPPHMQQEVRELIDEKRDSFRATGGE